MKKSILGLIFILCLSSSAIGETRYKGHSFLILDEVYKNPVITYANHNKRVDYQEGAIKMCQSYGMKLASKNDIDLIIDFLNNKSSIGKKNTRFWLKEIATGQINSNMYINDSKNHAYVLFYNSIISPPQAYLSASNKTSGQSSWYQAICIVDAPPIDDAYRISIIKDDYTVYLGGNGDSLFGYIKNYSNKLEGNSIDRKYLNRVIENFEKIVQSDKINNLQEFHIDILNEDKTSLRPDTMQIVNIFNGILVYNED